MLLRGRTNKVVKKINKQTLNLHLKTMFFSK